MTVKELINYLSKVSDKNKNVVISSGWEYSPPPNELLKEIQFNNNTNELILKGKGSNNNDE